MSTIGRVATVLSINFTNLNGRNWELDFWSWRITSHEPIVTTSKSMATQFWTAVIWNAMLIKTFVRIQRFVRLHNVLPSSIRHDVPGSATICQYHLGSYSFLDPANSTWTNYYRIWPKPCLVIIGYWIVLFGPSTGQPVLLLQNLQIWALIRQNLPQLWSHTRQN